MTEADPVGPTWGRRLIAGTAVSAVTMDEVLQRLLAAPAGHERLAVHFASTHTLVLAKEDERLHAALSGADVVCPDGVPLVWVGKLRGAHIGRVCGLDLMPALMDQGRAIGARHFFYGSTPEVVQRLADHATERYPGIIIAGTESPPYRPLTASEEAAMVERLNAARTDFVWVGLGTPKQDLWIGTHRDALDAAALLAVGAAFEIVGGSRRRAPMLMRRTGTEWLFRLALEPGRLWRRYLFANARFVMLVVAETLHDARQRMRRRRESSR